MEYLPHSCTKYNIFLTILTFKIIDFIKSKQRNIFSVAGSCVSNSFECYRNLALCVASFEGFKYMHNLNPKNLHCDVKVKNSFSLALAVPPLQQFFIQHVCCLVLTSAE